VILLLIAVVETAGIPDLFYGLGSRIQKMRKMDNFDTLLGEKDGKSQLTNKHEEPYIAYLSLD
jgi:hypothetical protein